MRLFLLTGIISLASIQVFADTIFVKAGANGSGLSWADAIGSLSEALSEAESGDKVWVAEGIYYPTHGADREISFSIPEGVQVFGGFAGSESSLQQRNIQTNKTVLSGNIGSESDQTDNSYTVVQMYPAHDNNLLDGFTIVGGYADGSGPSGIQNRCGGGLYIRSAKEMSASPTVQNCVFQNNYARDGGAVYLYGRKGECSPYFTNCRFEDNLAHLDGGAVFNDGRHEGIASPAFNHCKFMGNKGNYGGAICNYGGGGESSPSMNNCVFSNNEAYLRGGAIYNMDINGVTQPTVNECQFVSNKAVAGNGMYTFSKYKAKEEDKVNTDKN